MLKTIIAVTLAATVSGVLAGQLAPVEEAVEDPAFLAGLGISQPVYECAQRVLDGQDADAWAELSKTTATVGTVEETPTQARLRVCVEQDPFGWAGTDQEWAISLLNEGGK